METTGAQKELTALRALKAMASVIKTGLIWGFAWGLTGALIASTIDREGKINDMWINLCVPGFVCGVAFAVVFRIAEGHHRFDDVKLSRLAVLSAFSGLLVGLFPFVAGTPNSAYPIAYLVAAILSSTIFGSMASAVGLTMMFRAGRDRPTASAEADS
ncbi:MAG: hypothetical protein CMO80_08910 [Verrucomicrobiales bacterium]|nr:hypothetical protein [Verrucomicrobiales bacterium]|tara:strand:+ start:432 stop:905 length:474 start_codon:yes stop_codon:yes gene_type:complete